MFYSLNMTLDIIEMILNIMPWVWLAVLIICCVIEAFTMALTTIWAAIAALPMIFIARTHMPLQWQLLIFALITVILIIFTRPFAVKKLKIGKNTTNVNSLIGEEILITKAVSKFQKGEGKTKNGVIWNITSQSEEEITKGSTAKVVEVNGNTLIVDKEN